MQAKGTETVQNEGFDNPLSTKHCPHKLWQLTSETIVGVSI
jgi:hypothetical protein